MKRIWTDIFAFKKRRQLFEFHDLAWVPASIHDDLRYVNNWTHKVFKTKDCFIDIVAQVAQSQNVSAIIDLCSGGGGLTSEIKKDLATRYRLTPKLVMTDLFPPADVCEAINNRHQEDIAYEPASIDASNLPERLSGMRTLFASFHHLPFDVAQAVLKDAYEKRQPIVIGEMLENNLLGCIGSAFTFFLSWAVLTFRRPFKWSRFFRATVFPVVPLMYCFDAFASVLRTHTYEDLEKMTRPFSTDYSWRITRVQLPGLWTPASCLIGVPKAKVGAPTAV